MICQKLLWLLYVNFSFTGKEHLCVRHTSCLYALEKPFRRMSILASSHLSLFLTWCSGVFATGRTALEVRVSSLPGSALKRRQRRHPPAPVQHGHTVTLGWSPLSWELISPSPTRPYSSLPWTQMLQFSSAELDQQLHFHCPVNWFCRLWWILSSSLD